MQASVIRVRRGGSRSWLDYVWARAFGARLASRLEERCRGERGVFITLTYDRALYESPRELYRRASEKKHVAEFMKRLANFLGERLSGRWICKMEFQEGGWVHFHLILLGVSRIDHGELSRLWGHGFVWVNRLTKENRRYMSKYVAKGDGLPAFLYGERPRSVKVIRTSKGFWREATEPRPSKPPADETLHLDAYRPIGESLRLADSTSIVHGEDGSYRAVRVSLDVLLRRLRDAGYRYLSRDGAWLVLGGAGGRQGASRRPPRVYLRRSQKRGDALSESAWPEWLNQLLGELLDDRRGLA